jgi:two-component system, NarL family, sensor kinase
MDASESRIYLKVLVFSLLLATVLIGFVVSFYKQQKQFNKERVKAEIRTIEEERKKMSSNLHDDLGPVLATIKIYANAITSTNEQDMELVGSINKYLDKGINMIRGMANALLPRTLERNGLRSALEVYIAQIEQYVPFKIHFFFPDIFLGLSKEAELHLYRIVQEIITNTIKHAHASVLQINAEIEDGYLKIYTVDDGKGFDYTNHNFVQMGCGLSNIKSRVELLAGKSIMLAGKNEGVRYELIIPIQKSKPKVVR